MENKRMVVDTGIFIEYLRAKNKSKTILKNLPDNAELYISSVTLYELYMGATSPQKWVDVKTLTDDIPVLPFTKTISEKLLTCEFIFPWSVSSQTNQYFLFGLNNSFLTFPK